MIDSPEPAELGTFPAQGTKVRVDHRGIHTMERFPVDALWREQKAKVCRIHIAVRKEIIIRKHLRER